MSTYVVHYREYLADGSTRHIVGSAMASIGSATYFLDMLRRATARVGCPMDIWLVPA